MTSIDGDFHCSGDLSRAHNPKVAGSNPAPATKNPQVNDLGVPLFSMGSVGGAKQVSNVGVEDWVRFAIGARQRSLPELVEHE